MRSSDKSFVFFWNEDAENGFMSQWYHAAMTIEGITYLFCEQYMMAKKALLFEDYEIYSQIMKAKTPRDCKRLGRLVHNFDAAKWHTVREEIVYHANIAKFSQNEELREQLLQTGDAILAEASPLDKIWGIGMSADDVDAINPEQWNGQNLLGKILMKVRTELA